MFPSLFDPPAVLKAFRSNIWWGAYRVIASYRWPTQCRASLRINGPTRRIQWQGKERAQHFISVHAFDRWVHYTVTQLPYHVSMFIQVQPSWNSMSHYFTIQISSDHNVKIKTPIWVFYESYDYGFIWYKCYMIVCIFRTLLYSKLHFLTLIIVK